MFCTSPHPEISNSIRLIQLIELEHHSARSVLDRIFQSIYLCHCCPGMNFVPRGSLIYNAEMVYAIVVYTGNDTKVAFHLKEKETWKSKRVPIMDDMTDKVFLALIYLIFAASLLLECIQYFTTLDKTFKPFEWINILQRCIPISLMLLLEIINFAITFKITKGKKGSPFSHKV